MCPLKISFRKIAHFIAYFLAISLHSYGQSTFNIKWGTHHAFDGNLTGPNYISTDSGFSTAKAAVLLKSLNAAGSIDSELVDDVDLIELGFFDTNPNDDGTASTISPNTSATDLFKGVWTPLSTETVIAQDWNRGTLEDGSGGEFYFYSQFSDDSLGGEESEAAVDWKVVHNNLNSNSLSFDDVLDYGGGGSPANDNVVDDRVNALISASASNPVMLGIRFYDSGGNPSSGSGSTRYNTIMSTDWTLDWGTGQANLDLLEWTGSAVQVQDSLVFEFDNSEANTANISKVGTSDTQITSNDFVTTITYFDGDESINVGDGGIGSSVFSGFDGTGRIYGGNDGNIVTLHSASGNTGTDAYEFDGDFYNAETGTASTDITIVKSGTGDQILSGNLNLADSDNTSASGGLNITAGKLILKPASGKTQAVEYLTGTGTLVLDNSGVNTDTIVTLGFANQTSSSFSGAVVLDGTGGTSKISVSSGTSDSDYDNEQTLSGVISQSGGTDKKLVKDGVGRLVLSGNNSFEGGLDINGGTVQLGNANGAGTGAGVITINTGKLEVASGVTVTETINGSTTGKSMIGGDGTIGSVTVGSGASEIDVISPGEGHSSSTSSAGSTQQVARNTSLADAIGSLTITTLNLNDGGVFDWEIGDFSGSTAGSDWDLLNVGTLNFDPSSSTVSVNIQPLIADGSMGETPGGMWSNKTGTSGFKFLDVTTWANAPGSSQTITSGFNINSSSWLYNKNDPYGDWSVYYDTGTTAFYLQYSAVPEPSTYMMVTGLLMVPGMSYLRRIRRKKNSVEEESSL